MSRQRNAAPARMRSSLDDRRERTRSTNVDQALEVMRRCVADCGYTFDSLASAMGRDKGYVYRVLHGEKPMTLLFITDLPDDLEALYEERRAEHFGRIVVTPLTGVAAMKAVVSGLIGLMAAPELPARASNMAKAELDLALPRVVNR